MIPIGQRISEERIKRGYTLDAVAKATKIRVSFLIAIETGDYSKLPSSAYALGFVKNYIDFLGLPKKEYLALFKREFDEKEFFTVLPEGLTRKEKISFPRFKVTYRIVSVFFIILLLFGFILYEYRYILSNPNLELLSPAENQKISSSSVVVKGKTDTNATITIDNTPVSVDENGLFQKTIPVASGAMSIHITAESRFGKKTILDRHIVVK